MAPSTTDLNTRPHVRARVRAAPESIRFLADLCRSYFESGLGLSLDSQLVAQLRLGIQEMVTNVVRHAYRDGESGLLDLELGFEGGELVVVLRDRGMPFDPTAGRGALPAPDELAEGGYGLGLVREVMTRIDYAYDIHEGNRLTMRRML